MALVVAAAAIAAAALLWVGEPPDPVIVAVGPDGSARAEWSEGRPVWVVNDGGDVLVLDAINPHPFRGLDELVGWCEPAQAFQAWWDGSRFDRQGRWVFGPAPHDLHHYELVARRNSAAWLGELVVAQGRSDDARTLPAPWCTVDGEQGVPPRYHEVSGSERELFEGGIVADAGAPARFCTDLAEEGACPADAVLVPDFEAVPDQGRVTLLGRFLGERRGGELHDVIYLPGG